jgi:hypothetical protein
MASSEPSDRQKAVGNRIGKPDSENPTAEYDRQKTVRRPSEVTQATNNRRCSSDGSDDPIVSSDDRLTIPSENGNRICKPNSAPSDGSDGSDGTYSLPGETAKLATPTIIAHIRERHAAKAAALGLVAKWSRHFGFVSVHDPTTGEWYDLATKDAPGWAKREAATRKRLWRGGEPSAFDLTRGELEELLARERPPEDVGITEEHPLEDD